MSACLLNYTSACARSGCDRWECVRSFGHFIIIYCPPGAQVRHLATNAKVRSEPGATWRPTNTHSVDCKWRKINVNVSPPRNSIKPITCSHRNNLTLDSAHYVDPCNIPAERERDRVKGLRDMRDTDWPTARITLIDRQRFAELIDRYTILCVRLCDAYTVII